MLDEMFGISELTGVPCPDRREIHHITYRRYGKELIADLIPVCPRCHDIITTGIRKYRYESRPIDPDDHERLTPIQDGQCSDEEVIEIKDVIRTTPKTEKGNCEDDKQRIDLQDCRRNTPTSAQWSISKSDGSNCSGSKED